MNKSNDNGQKVELIGSFVDETIIEPVQDLIEEQSSLLEENSLFLLGRELLNSPKNTTLLLRRGTSFMNKENFIRQPRFNHCNW